MPKKNLIIFATIVLTALFLARLALRGHASAAPKSGAEITIDNFSFSPTTLTVKTGTQIVWTNRDDVPHTIVSEDHQFKSKALDTDEKFTFTAMQPGTYTYFCSIHPKMTAKVVVQ